MKNSILAKRYAEALFALGKEDGNFKLYDSQLKQLCDAWKNVAPEEIGMLTAPVYTFETREQILEQILAKADLSPIVSNFLKLLLHKERLNEFVNIVEFHHSMVDLEEGLTRGSLVVATAIDNTELEQIKDCLSKFSGLKVELTVVEDKNIIGGLIAKIGDLTIDGSLKTQLERLKRHMVN